MTLSIPAAPHQLAWAIGKSTLMLQALYGLANQGHKVLYVSGEESNRQIRLRSQRLDTVASELMVVSEVEIDAILGMIQADPPQVLVDAEDLS